MARFVTLEALKEVQHTLDTCANESLNDAIAWLAPKNKVHCGTNSQKNRIAIAMGITSLGTLDFCTRMFQCLGIEMTDDVRHYPSVKGSSGARQLAKTKTTARGMMRMMMT